MDFALTEEQRMISQVAQAYFAENATSERTRAAMAGSGVDQALWLPLCRELGLAGVAVAEACGGAGLGMVELALVAEAAGTHVAAVPLLDRYFNTLALGTVDRRQSSTSQRPCALRSAPNGR